MAVRTWRAQLGEAIVYDYGLAKGLAPLLMRLGEEARRPPLDLPGSAGIPAGGPPAPQSDTGPTPPRPQPQATPRSTSNGAASACRPAALQDF
jgi:hypothetical protein